MDLLILYYWCIHMQYRKLGKKAGIKLSEIGLGSWLTIGGRLAKQKSFTILERAVESGINFIDTADAYNEGKVEETIGEFLKEETIDRKKLVIASKVYFPMSDDPNDCGLNRKHIMESIEGTLNRLNLDYLDIYFCHRFDYWTPLEETILSMNTLIQDQLIHYWGTSCWTSYQLERVQWLSKALNAFPPVVEQPMYNMFYRTPELEIFEVCRHHGIGIVVFSPLAEGFLTGKYLNEKIPPNSRVVTAGRKKILRDQQDQMKLGKIKEVADRDKLSLVQLAISWILNRNEINSVICGATEENQIEENAMASGTKLSQGLLDELEEILQNKPWYDYKYIPQEI
jgi:aryl-alcohol dehydrogenase-like predicted oxidoreductase